MSYLRQQHLLILQQMALMQVVLVNLMSAEVMIKVGISIQMDGMVEALYSLMLWDQGMHGVDVLLETVLLKELM